MTSYFAVFAHTTKRNGWYLLEDAIGARVWKTEKGANRRAAELNACPTAMTINPAGYVVRPANYIKNNSCEITASLTVRFVGAAAVLETELNSLTL